MTPMASSGLTSYTQTTLSSKIYHFYWITGIGFLLVFYSPDFWPCIHTRTYARFINPCTSSSSLWTLLGTSSGLCFISAIQAILSQFWFPVVKAYIIEWCKWDNATILMRHIKSSMSCVCMCAFGSMGVCPPRPPTTHTDMQVPTVTTMTGCLYLCVKTNIVLQ